MNKRGFTTLYDITKKSIQTIIMDYSFLVILTLVVCLNIISFMYYDTFFTDKFNHAFKNPLLLTSVSSSIILMIYGGYLGNKLFAQEIEEKIMPSLLMIPAGKNPVYFGKILAGITILLSLIALSFFHIYLSIHYWGAISFLTVTRILDYLISSFLASTFVFFLSVVIGLFTKKSMASMLFTTVYVVGSFFATRLVQYAETGINTYTKLIAFPFLNIRFCELFIIKYGSLPLIFLLIPLLGIFCSFIISYILFRGVKL